MPGGFHPFHAGHQSLYNSALKAFPGADVYVAATNDTKTRPFPFAIKEKLAKLAGVADKHFVQVKSPFQAKEITQHYNPDEDVLVFVRSEKDKTEQPKPGGTKKDGSPAYFQPWTGKNLQPFSKHAYIAYLPTVEFGPGITSATEIRNAWPKLDDRRKTAMVMSLYPVTQKNPKLAANVVKMLDMGMGNELDESWKNAIAGGAMALSALGAGAQTMPNVNAQQVELANKYYNVLVQRAKEDGRELDRRTLNFLKAKAENAAAVKIQQSSTQSQPQSQPKQGFPTQGSERKVSKDINNFESKKLNEFVSSDSGDEKSYLLQLADDLADAMYGPNKNKQEVKNVSGKILAAGGNVKITWNDDSTFNVIMYHPTYFKQGHLIRLVGRGDELTEFAPPSSDRGDGDGEDNRSRRLRKLLEIAIRVAEEQNVGTLDKIPAMNTIAGDDFFSVAVQGILPDISDREYMFVLESAYKTVKQGMTEGKDFNRCFDQACKLYDRAVSKNLEPKLVQVADFQGDGNGADPRWMKLPQHVWQHYVVIVGDQVLDPTAKQFGDTMPTQYQVSDLDRIWGKQYQIRPSQDVAEGEVVPFKQPSKTLTWQQVPKDVLLLANDWLWAEYDNTGLDAVMDPKGFGNGTANELQYITAKLQQKGWTIDHNDENDGPDEYNLILTNKRGQTVLLSIEDAQTFSGWAKGTSSYGLEEGVDPFRSLLIAVRQDAGHYLDTKGQAGGRNFILDINQRLIQLERTGNPRAKIISSTVRDLMDIAQRSSVNTKGVSFGTLAHTLMQLTQQELRKVDTQQDMAEGEEIVEGPFVQRLGRPNKVNVYVRHAVGKPSLLIATDIPYAIYDKFIAKAMQKYPQFRQTDFSFKSSDKITEFAPPGSDDREPDEEEVLRKLAAQWWNGSIQQMKKAQQTLEAMGWDIGLDQSGDDDAGVFVIRIGDIHGDSYIAFPHSELGLNEDYLDEN